MTKPCWAAIKTLAIGTSRDPSVRTDDKELLSVARNRDLAGTRNAGSSRVAMTKAPGGERILSLFARCTELPATLKSRTNKHDNNKVSMQTAEMSQCPFQYSGVCTPSILVPPLLHFIL